MFSCVPSCMHVCMCACPAAWKRGCVKREDAMYSLPFSPSPLCDTMSTIPVHPTSSTPCVICHVNRDLSAKGVPAGRCIRGDAHLFFSKFVVAVFFSFFCRCCAEKACLLSARRSPMLPPVPLCVFLGGFSVASNGPSPVPSPRPSFYPPSLSLGFI